ncbi:MAG: penicillin-binding protein 2 [Crocinitomicaceae bacterium]|nr:penicillin-binding protein 2 [Crocinitomicaceae bacterium]|tara:strand:- start:5082 stop:6917 length:1836 start_codon:yes stop_codon:yes gene_type:complete
MNPFNNRRYVVLGIFLTVSLIFLGRLFYIQVIDDSYKLSAKNQALRYVTQYPVRGLIYDRNNELLVYNEAAYDLMVIPKRIKRLDTLAFCNLLGITDSAFDEKIAKSTSYSRFKASVFEKQIPADEWATISEKLYKFSGFFGEKRTLRKYPKSAAAHVLGYISEATPGDLKKDSYYQKGDYVGKRGLEKEYEKRLRGVRGRKVLLVDVHNRAKGSYMNGKYDTLPIAGENLISTIDRELQMYGEQLMRNKRGSIVAIEPSTGEILSMVSSPGYDPNLLVGRPRSKNYKMLQANDSLNPLFNRSINAMYRPGSIFKLVESLVALDEGVITTETRFRCNRGIIGCHGSHTNDDLVPAIQHSCNPYFWNVFKRLVQRGKYSSIFKDAAYGLNLWQERVKKFGLGVQLKTDLPGLKKGNVPDVAFYNRWYGEYRWAFSTIYSVSIGEGEMLVVPIQMANLAATIANRGYFYEPHLIKSIGADSVKRPEFTIRNETEVDPEYFDPVIEAMYKVVNEDGGTARRARMDSIEVCGKTGTVQNEPWPDHSVFIAFAPRENPKIAIAVYVEYSDFGGTWAAPISSLMIEKYLTGEVKRPEKEKRILDAVFLDIYDGKKEQ